MKARHARILERLRALAAAPREATASPEPGSPVSVGEAAAGKGRAPVRSLRVPVETLDRMLDLAGEIAVGQGRLTTLLETGGSRAEQALEIHQEQGRLQAELQELVMRVRMVPLAPTLSRSARLVRDTAAFLGKAARLVLTGDEVEVDTKVVELIADPLSHLVRNAVAHGIETPEARRAAGKEPCGTIVVTSVRETSSIVLEISDDGAGLDRSRILDRARGQGLFAGDDADLGDAEIQRLIFEPGFSTAAGVDAVSGRGVGLDVVRRNVEALRGQITVTSVRGRGTTFTIRLPLTLAIIHGFAVLVAGETFLVPLESVVSCMDLPAGGETHRETGLLEVPGGVLPFLRLRHRLSLPGGAPGRERALVVQHHERKVGLVVDTLLGEGQAVIKPLAGMLRAVPGFAGSTIRGDGTVALLLDVAGLVDEAAPASAGTTNLHPVS